MCDWICPQCGSDYHSGCDIGMKTLMYFKPIYKNGVNINPDMNTSTFNIKCHSCKTSFVMEYGFLKGNLKWAIR